MMIGRDDCEVKFAIIVEIACYDPVRAAGNCRPTPPKPSKGPETYHLHSRAAMRSPCPSDRVCYDRDSPS